MLFTTVVMVLLHSVCCPHQCFCPGSSGSESFLFYCECRICSRENRPKINIVRLSLESLIAALNFDQLLPKLLMGESQNSDNSGFWVEKFSINFWGGDVSTSWQSASAESSFHRWWMLAVRILVHSSGQSEETHENLAYFHPTISQSPEWREKRESKRHQSCDRPTHARVCLGMVWYGMVCLGMVWYGMVWYGMVWFDIIWYV